MYTLFNVYITHYFYDLLENSTGNYAKQSVDR